MKRFVYRCAGIERELVSRVYLRVLIWFSHIGRMNEYHMARRVSTVEVIGRRVRGRLRLGWMNGTKVALCSRGMTVEAPRQCKKNRKEWRALVYM